MIAKGLIALAIMAMLGVGLKAVYTMGFNAREVIALQEATAAQARLDALELNWRKTYDAALKKSAQREYQVRNDAHDAYDAAERLRSQLSSAAQQLAAYAGTPIADAAIAYSKLLQNCTDEYRDLAEKSDRHVNDIRTMIDAWPK